MEKVTYVGFIKICELYNVDLRSMLIIHKIYSHPRILLHGKLAGKL